MPLMTPPIMAIPGDIRALEQYWRMTAVIPDAGSVGLEEVAGAEAANDDLFYAKRAGELTFSAIADSDIPATIARDTEVTTAANAAQAAAEATAAADLAAHEAVSDPHPGYTTAAELSTALSALNLASGVYTPTLTNVANLDGSTAFECQYLRVGSVVTVSGKVSVNPTAGASTQLGISLPVASNLGAAEDCSGSAFASGIAGQGAAILGDAANNRAQMQWIAVDTTDQPMFFTFQYSII